MFPNKVELLHLMKDSVTDLSKIVSEMSHKLSFLEQIISTQGADISRLYRIINRKDK